MIVVAGLLHEIYTRPHKGIAEHGNSVPVSKHYHAPEDAHNDIVIDHTITGQRFQKRERDEWEVNGGFYKICRYPTGKDRAPCLEHNQKTEDRPEYHKRTVIYFFEKAFCHSYQLSELKLKM